jgi:hypothetical protein
MQRNAILGLGVVLTVLGLFLFGIAYSSYQPSNSNYQNCLDHYNLAYCNSNRPVISWGVPLEISGGAITALGLGLVVVLFLGSRLESKKLTS